MKPVWAAWLIGFSIILSLLAAGILYLSSSKPKGEPIRLNPLPTARPLVVQVGGAVAQPGVYQLSMGSRVQDAIQAAGGPLPAANIELVNQAAPLQDGQLVWVPYIETAPAAAPTSAAVQTQRETEQASTTSPSFPINLNTATFEELLALPGIGDVRARSIIDYRSTHGPFQSIEDIQAVEGIGPGIFEKVKELITVDNLPPGSVPP